MYIIIGLGNPGKDYESTPHNVAWKLFDFLLPKRLWEFNKYAQASMLPDRLGSEDVLFVKPETFMNKSGEVVSYLIKEYGMKSENLIVAHDDVDLPLGSVRISYDRGDGGHNGVKSIMEHLGSREFVRVRVGVSRLLDDGRIIKPDVVKNFSPAQIEEVEALAKNFGKILETIVLEGKEKAMTKYN